MSVFAFPKNDIADAIKVSAEDDAMALFFAAEEAKDKATATYAAARFQRLSASKRHFKRGPLSEAPSKLSVAPGGTEIAKPESPAKIVTNIISPNNSDGITCVKIREGGADACFVCGVLYSKMPLVFKFGYRY